jgi:hydroxyacylglutathione hydrolase
MHTPGHTPEHLSFVVTDTAGADRPMGVFTGDFIFVGDVGRPDLLERAAKYAGTMEDGARVLYRSLQKFRNALPDYVQLWPGHGAGSACGKALGAVPQTTLGYEKLFNWGLADTSEDEFVKAVLAGQPEPPMYFAQMKRINRDGPRILNGFHRPQRLPESRLETLMDEGALVVDTRHAADYAQAHIPGTLNVPLGNSFTTWAGSVLPYDRPFYLIIDDAAGGAVDVIVRDLAMIGLDEVAGCFGPDVVQTWIDTDRAAQGVPEVAPEQLEELMRLDAVELVDVRNSSEWEAGRVPGARNFPLGRLAEQLDRIPRGRPLVVHCESGGRAAVAIGMLQANGFDDVRHLTGDFSGWKRSGRRVEQADALIAV